MVSAQMGCVAAGCRLRYWVGGARPSANLGGAAMRWVWESTKPGITTRPAALMSSADLAPARFSIRRVGPTLVMIPSEIRMAPSLMIPN